MGSTAAPAVAIGTPADGIRIQDGKREVSGGAPNTTREARVLPKTD